MTAEKLNWFQLALQLRGSVFPAIFPRILLCSAFGFIVSLLYSFGFSIPDQVFDKVITNVAYNLVLGLLLVFRTNKAYERFWEGRKTWGTIVISALNLARRMRVAITELEPIDRENKVSAIRLLGALAVANKLFLRQLSVDNQIEALVSQTEYLELKEAKNPPLKIALWIAEYLQQQHKRGCLTKEQLIAMNQSLDLMVDGLISCERILETPIPPAYAIYLKRLLIIYCIVLPFEVVDELSWWTAPVMALISFIVLGVEEIGHQIEDPFGMDDNDLPLDDICTGLIRNLEEFTGALPHSLTAAHPVGASVSS